MSRKIPTPIRSTPSTNPYEAMTASQRADINELVQKNRALEQTLKRLKEDHQRQQDELRVGWQAERKEWVDGCDSLQAFHRIAHLRTTVALEDERLAMIRERDIARQQRAALLQRDYQLIMFQARESELEFRVDELEEDLDRSKQLNMRMLQEWKDKISEVLEDAKDKEEALAEAERARNAAQADAAKFREEHAVLKSKVATSGSEYERTKLRLEDAETVRTELERKHTESEQTIVKLQQQLRKWQELDSKDSAGAKAEQKRRMELEAQVADLEERLSSVGQELQTEKRAIEKERRRVGKLKESLVDQATHAEEAQQKLEQAKEELDAANRTTEQLRSAQEELARKSRSPTKGTDSGEQGQDNKQKQMMSKLTASLDRQARETEKAKQLAIKSEKEAEKAKNQLVDAQRRIEELETKLKQSAKPRSRTISAVHAERDVSHEAMEVEPSIPEPSPQRKPQSKPRPKPRPPGKRFSAVDKITEDASPPPAKKARTQVEYSDIEELSPPPTPPPAKVQKAPKKKAAPKKASPEDEGDSDTDAARQGRKAPAPPKAKAKKGKRKASPEAEEDLDSDNVVAAPPSKKPKNKKPTSEKAADSTAADKKGKRKAVVEEAEAEASAPPAKKKKLRRLNAFAASTTNSFDWNQFSQPGGGLDIPRELSPIKDSGPVPQRSVFGGRTSSSQLFRKG